MPFLITCDPHSPGVQVVLTGEPALVASVCSLLQKALQHNAEALPSLYQTGLYFFALAYCGSNLLEIARLFQVYMSLVPASLREQLYLHWDHATDRFHGRQTCVCFTTQAKTAPCRVRSCGERMCVCVCDNFGSCTYMLVGLHVARPRNFRDVHSTLILKHLQHLKSMSFYIYYQNPLRCTWCMQADKGNCKRTSARAIPHHDHVSQVSQQGFCTVY